MAPTPPFPQVSPPPKNDVFVVAVQPDAKILIGGVFTTLAPNGGVPVPRNRIARLNPDGTLDPDFNPSANDYVSAIALQPDGKILVGGGFTGIAGQTRLRIARLNPNGTVDLTFNPAANNNVTSLAVQADGKILVGGSFSSVGGQPRDRIARLDPATGLADSFSPFISTFGSTVYSLAVQADGKILAGGSFSNVSGQGRQGIARLNPNGSLDLTFNPTPSNDGVVEIFSLAVQADGKILVGGLFTSIGGQARNRIARLDPATGLADTFNPNSDGAVRGFAQQPDGKIAVVGDFNGIGGQVRKGVARLDRINGLADSFQADQTFQSSFFRQTSSIALQQDGKILVSGNFISVRGLPRSGIARLERDGLVDRTLKFNGAVSDVIATAVQRDGKIIIGGSFASVLGMARNNVARLNSDGTLDPNFNPNADGNVLSIAVQEDGNILLGGAFANVGGQTRSRFARLNATTGQADSFDPSPNGSVDCIAVQGDGSILAGGAFTGIGGASRNHLARLNPTSGMADSFDPNANNTVFTLAVQPDGKILAGGAFSGANSIGGEIRNHIARLDPVTGLADSFDPNANNDVLFIALEPGGKILAGGAFTSIGGQTRNHLARLDSSSGLADSFDPNASDVVRSIALQANGKVVTGGNFTNIGGQTRNHIARVDPDAGLADSFDPNANGLVRSLLLSADGKVVAGGQFNTIGGQPRDGFARLSNSTAALQELSVTPTTITWARSGSSPVFTRVTFEYSDDNLNYTQLGSGMPQGSNWVLPGLNLSTTQPFYIRARGYYSGGEVNGSESTTEYVRHGPGVIPTPTPTPGPPTPTPSITPPVTPTPTPPPTPPATITPTVTPPPPPVPTPTPTDPTCEHVLYRQYFDNVAPPTLPEGWTASTTAGPGTCEPSGTCAAGAGWITTPVGFDSYPNAIFSDAPSCVTDSVLVSAPITPGAPFSGLYFRQNYDLESGFDGAVLEISKNGGPFLDIESSCPGCYYNGTISSDYHSPLAGRRAWTGNSNGDIPTYISLTFLSLSGNDQIRLRFRLATDCSVAGTGWKVDTLKLYIFLSCPGGTPTATPTPGGPTPTPLPPTPTPIPGLLLDTFTGSTTTTFTASTPHTYMGDGWTNSTLPPGSTVKITGLTLYMVAATTQAYTNVVARIQFWNTYNATATPVFSDPTGPLITVDLGPINTTANNFVAIPVTLATPLILAGGPGTNWGFAQNFQGDTGSGLSDTTDLTSLITAHANGLWGAGRITTAAPPYTGYYRNASNRLDFNFDSNDVRSLAGYNAQGVGIVIAGTAEGGASPTPTPTPIPFSGALLDTVTGADTMTYTISTPRTYMGDGWTNTAIPANSTWVTITGLTLYMVPTTNQAYTDVVARIQFWNTYDPSVTPVFGSASGPLITVDLGPINTTAVSIIQIPVTLSDPVILPGGPGTNWGFAQNFQGNIGGGLTDTTNLTSLITAHSNGMWAAGQITSGTAPQFGYYRNASNRVDFNFSSSDLRTLAGDKAQGIGIIIGGTAHQGPTPTPSPAPITPTPTPTPIVSPPPEGSQTPTPVPTATPDLTPTPTPSQAQPLNISTRLRIRAGNNVGIGGFIINGTAPKTVAVRGIGPSLTAFGLSDALADPTLELRDSSGLLLKPNDNWQDDSADAAQFVARGLALQDPKESGVMATLQPNASYTAILAGKNQGEGVGVIEIYDVNQEVDSELANISTRGFVLTDNNVMIGGFILGGTYNTGMVVRGIGPSLAQFGLNPVLADPTLELHDSNGAILVSNDNWRDDVAGAAQLVVLGLAPQNANESAIVVSLPPGAFTAILAGKNSGTGIGLVEIYNVH